MKKLLLPLFCLILLSCGESESTPDQPEAPPKTAEGKPEILPQDVPGFRQIEFDSEDGTLITADFTVVEREKRKGSILLCHQARWSRGEYRETAQWLADLGYSSLAIDQRSGDAVNEIKNETAARAAEKGLGQDYLDAEQDIRAGVIHLFEDGGEVPVIIVGSSYSASLVLKVAAEREEVKAVAAFSPGEYFEGFKLGDFIEGLDKPAFFTSSKEEAEEVKTLASRVKAERLTQFIPEGEGYHGSRALWTQNEGHEEYRAAFLAWLQGL